MKKIRFKEIPIMEKKEFVFFGYYKLILQLDNNYTTIPYFGKKSYGVCGRETRLIFMDELTGKVNGLIFKGGYIDRLYLEGDEKLRLHVNVDYFDPPHPVCKSKESLSYEVLALL